MHFLFFFLFWLLSFFSFCKIVIDRTKNEIILLVKYNGNQDGLTYFRISLTKVKKASSTPCRVFAEVSTYGIEKDSALDLANLVSTFLDGRSTLLPTTE